MFLTYKSMMLVSVTRFGDFLHLGRLLKPLATIILLKSPTVLGNFCKGVKIYHFSSPIIFGKLLLTFGDFFLVTLDVTHNPPLPTIRVRHNCL